MFNRLFSALRVDPQLHEDDVHTPQASHPPTISEDPSYLVPVPGSWPESPTMTPPPAGSSVESNAPSGFFAGSSQSVFHSIVVDHASVRLHETQNDGIYIQILPRAEGAGFRAGNHTTCLEGTRKAELQRIEEWVVDFTQTLVYWLCGVPGSGKSTIAQTFAENSFACGRLVVAFFCSRDFSDRRNIHLIFPTLAYDLACQSPEFRAALIPIISESPDIGGNTLEVQLKDFLIRPLLLAKIHAIIVIDALDECEDKESTSAILSVIARRIHEIPFVKVLITGRPEPRIRSGFRLPLLRPHAEVFMLHEVDMVSVDQDIELYLRTHFSMIPATRRYWGSTEPWPSDKEISAAVKKCAGIFVVAAIIVKLVASAPHDPREGLRIISHLDITVHERRSGLDRTYDQVLFHSLGHGDPENAEFYDLLQIVVGSIVLAFDPLSRASLATILGITSEDVQTTLDPLHSIFIVPDSEFEAIRICHKSLADYLTDVTRCMDLRFYINPPIFHSELASRCLRLMVVSLKINICDLRRYALNADVDDLDTRREKYIGSGLEYACRSWAKHLRLGSRNGDNIGNVVELLKDFFSHHLLQWREVLSIVGDLCCAVYSLRDVTVWMGDFGLEGSDLLAIVRDSERFVLRFFDVIESSAPHIYESALCWCPSSSLVRKLYEDQMSTDVKLFSAVDESWDACIRTIQLRQIPSLVAFSPGDDLIAVGEPKVVEIFETATGQRRATLMNNNYPLSLAFHPDNSVLVTGCRNGRVDVWDFQTGGLVNILEGHTEDVCSVVFSPSGTMFASSSNDRTIRVWNMDSLNCRLVLNGHLDHVQAICWSPTEHEIISGSVDTTIKVWSVPGEICSETFSIHASHVRSVASSPDSSMIASGSLDGTIKVFGADTGDVLCTALVNQEVVESIRFLDRDRIMYATSSGTFVIRNLIREDDVLTFKYEGLSPAISSDGTRLASSSRNVVKVWQTNSKNKDQAIPGHHTARVNCVCFSNDGRLVASGSDDRTVKVWDTSTGRCKSTFYGHSDRVRRVTFSPNSTLGASHAADDAIRVWDVRTGRPVAAFGENGLIGVDSICFSPDDSQLAYTKVDMASLAVELWDVITGDCLASMNVDSYRSIGGSYMSFDSHGTGIILRGIDKTQRWGISPDHSLLPMISVPIEDTGPPTSSDVPSDQYSHSLRSSWILDKQHRRILWVPSDLGQQSYCHGKNIVFASDRGRIIIIDFPDLTL